MLPTYFPSIPESQACAAYVPENLSGLWKELSTTTLRIIVYRIIAGLEVGDVLDNAIYERQLLVMAELLPPVWGVTRELSNQVWVHDFGICLNCKRLVSFPDGLEDPLVRVCKRCYGVGKAISLSPTPFLNSITSWPIQYQVDCVKYLAHLFGESYEPNTVKDT